jgi:hypothetical protein
MEIYKQITKKTKQLIGLKCDTCPQRCDFDHKELVVLEKGEINKYHFCSYRCVLEFVIAEMNKENPNTDIIYGKKH